MDMMKLFGAFREYAMAPKTVDIVLNINERKYLHVLVHMINVYIYRVRHKLVNTR
jgi:hypothetical protein